jgi:polyhydroxybutyrate depolymerase
MRTFLPLCFTCLVACGGEDPSSIPRQNGGQTSTGSPASGTQPAPDNGSEPGVPGPPAPATGCSATGGLGAGNHDLAVTSGGRERTARVHVPSSSDPTKAVAVVLNFHGRMSNASQQELISKATSKADAAGFVVVYPEGVGQTWNAGLCCGQAQSENVDDVAFTRDLLDALGKKLCVDPKRVFATGLSNGAFMSNRLACELSDRIAAIGPVAGQLMMTTCTPSRAVPVMYFHGDADGIVSYEGKYGMPGAQASAKAWATRNGCDATAKQTYAKGDTTCMTYSGCDASADVTLCTVAGGGHTWPGGTSIPYLGKTSTDVDATCAMWTFFEAHPMP